MAVKAGCRISCGISNRLSSLFAKVGGYLGPLPRGGRLHGLVNILYVGSGVMIIYRFSASLAPLGSWATIYSIANPIFYERLAISCPSMR